MRKYIYLLISILLFILSTFLLIVIIINITTIYIPLSNSMLSYTIIMMILGYVYSIVIFNSFRDL